jgi:hypothetical protein
MVATNQSRLALVFLIVASSRLALAADAKGWYDPCCDLTTFHLIAVPGQPPNREFILRIATGMLHFNDYLAGPDWWTATGQNCSKAGDCAEVTKARLQFQEMGKKRVSGRYEIDFEGHHFEGEYKVKYRHKGKPCICE